MSTESRLDQVYAEADRIRIDDRSRLTFFSDIHRGTGSAADDFAHNQHLFFYALNHYFKEKYTYVEVGDGDELWENRRYRDIKAEHDHVFWKLGKFMEERRFHLIWGNHNRQCKNAKYLRRNLDNIYDPREKQTKPLFPNLICPEGIVLEHEPSGKTILVAHGHQGQLFNDKFWWVARWLVRNPWRALQTFGFKDPTSPARNFKTRLRVERAMKSWVEKRKVPLIAGHTHRPTFPAPGETPYFNDGSCVHPRCITNIEIADGMIALVKWHVDVDAEGVMRVKPKPIKPPQPLAAYLV